MTYGSKQKNNTVSAQWQWFAGTKTTLSGKWLGFWTNDKPYIPEDAPGQSRVHQLVEVDRRLRQLRSRRAASHTSRDTSRAATRSRRTSRTTPRASSGEHDIKFGVQYTKGRSNSKGGYFQNYVNFLYPYRWTQSVANMQSWYGDTGLVFYNNKDTINPFLTVRTGDSLGAFFDDQWTPTRRLTINLGLRFDHMTSKYGTGKVYDFPSLARRDQRPAARAARPRLDRRRLRLQDVVAARRAELPADGGRQDRRRGPRTGATTCRSPPSS